MYNNIAITISGDTAIEDTDDSTPMKSSITLDTTYSSSSCAATTCGSGRKSRDSLLRIHF
jgi:hypothetical protein